MTNISKRELLELAIKGANLSGKLGFGFDSKDNPYWIGDDKQSEPRYWNPIDDDQDALDLATRICLFDIAFILQKWINLDAKSGDPFEDTRMAIVQAAARLASNPKMLYKLAFVNECKCKWIWSKEEIGVLFKKYDMDVLYFQKIVPIQRNYLRSKEIFRILES